METQKIKDEIANKNAMEITTTDANAVANRLKAIDTLGVAIKKSLVKGINDDYAVIPNTSKPCLLLPGARKICMLYGLTASYPILQEDKERNLITTKCELLLNERIVAESYGSAVIGKQRDYGWEYNKALKIAQKRAFVGATLQVANLSKVFTQDTEDMQPTKPLISEETKKRAYELHNLFAKQRHTKPTKYSWVQYISSVQSWSKDTKDEMVNPYQLVEKHWDKEYEKWLLDDNGIKVEPFEIKKEEK